LVAFPVAISSLAQSSLFFFNAFNKGV
jgi:hypothetical protein